MARTAHRLAVAYLWLQAASVVGFWFSLLLPAVRSRFVVAGWPDTTLLVFWLPDLAIVATGSLGAALALARQHGAARPLLWLTTGGLGYATLWCVAVNLATGSGWLGTALMLPALGATCACLRAIERTP